MSLLVVGLSHRSAPVSVLERASLSVDAQVKLLHDTLAAEPATEATVLATCNRIELYADVDKFHAGVAELSTLLAQHSGVGLEELTPYLYVHYEDRAVHHLFSVACGLDSMVVGEGQILGQIKDALARGQELHTAGRLINDLFQQALRVGKRAHSETGIDRAGQSLVTFGLEQLAAGEPVEAWAADKRALVIGAGSMSSLAATTLARLGVRDLVIANRTTERAERLAAALSESGGVRAHAVPMASVADELTRADVAVSCTGATGLVLTAEVVATALAQHVVPDAAPGRDLRAPEGSVVARLAAVAARDGRVTELPGGADDLAVPSPKPADRPDDAAGTDRTGIVPGGDRASRPVPADRAGDPVGAERAGTGPFGADTPHLGAVTDRPVGAVARDATGEAASHTDVTGGAPADRDLGAAAGLPGTDMNEATTADQAGVGQYAAAPGAGRAGADGPAASPGDSAVFGGVDVAPGSECPVGLDDSLVLHGAWVDNASRTRPAAPRTATVPHARSGGPLRLALLDLAMPRDIDAAVHRLAGVRLVDIESLAEASADAPMAADVDQVRSIVSHEVAAFGAAQRAAHITPTVVALRTMAADVVSSEMARLDGRLTGLDEKQRAEITQTVRRVVDKLLHAPTVRVKQLASEPGGAGYADALRTLFDLDPETVASVSRADLNDADVKNRGRV